MGGISCWAVGLGGRGRAGLLSWEGSWAYICYGPWAGPFKPQPVGHKPFRATLKWAHIWRPARPILRAIQHGPWATGLFNTPSLQQCGVDYSVFSSSFVGCIFLVVYVNNIIIIRSDKINIQRLKHFLQSKFCTKDLDRLTLFLWHLSSLFRSINLSARWKYVLDILDEVAT